MDTLDRFIDGNFDRFVEELKTLLRLPSSSNETECDDASMMECAELVAQMMRDVGMQAQILPAKCHPAVFGQLKSKTDAKTLLVTSHYDVMPVEPLEEWVSDPYEPEIREGRIFARGASDCKGNFMAGLKAVEALLRSAGDVPLNLKFLVEGDDESGKGDMTAFAAAHTDLLQADAILYLDAGFTRDGNCPVHLGQAGGLRVELSIRTGSKNVYSIWTQLIPTATYPLAWALASLKDRKERVLIEGFYDDVLSPTREELELMKSYPWTDEGEMEFWGVSEFVTGVRGLEAVKRLLYEPTCSILGLETRGEEVPCEAHAQVHFHLVPNQRPADIVGKLKIHLKKHGFDEVEVSEVTTYPSQDPLAGSADSAIGRAIVRAADAVGVKAYLLPHSFEFGDKWVSLGRDLGGIDAALIGIGDPDRRAHMPNENLSLRHYRMGIKWVAGIYQEYAENT
jgi:acetylornithine deacetylase/succinyl-diaminopimelate desuccinylase-like protein